MFQKYHHNIAVTFTVALALIGLGLFSLYRWATMSVYMSYGPEEIPAEIGPYNVKDVIFLTIFTVTTPIGFLILVHSIMTLLRYLAVNNSYNLLRRRELSGSFKAHFDALQESVGTQFALYITTLLLAIGTFGTLSYFAWMWSKEVLNCGFIGCLDEAKQVDPEIMLVSPTSYGFRVSISAPVILLFVCLIVIFIAMLIREVYYYRTFVAIQATPTTLEAEQSLLGDSFGGSSLQNVNVNFGSSTEAFQSPTTTTAYTPFNTYYQKKPDASTPPKSATSTPEHHPQLNAYVDTAKPVLKHLILLLILTSTLFISIFFFSTIIPGSYRQYWPSTIANRAALHVANNEEDCKTWGAFACPEVENPVFHTIPIQVTSYLVLKLFPSNIIFYSFILVAIGFPFVTRLIPSVDNVLQKKVRIHTPTIFYWNAARRPKSFFALTSVYWSRYELLLSFWVTLGTSMFFFYWFHDHNYKSRWAHDPVMPFWDNLYRTTGQVAVLIFSLLMFPVARTSPVLQLLGISWDKGISFHRWAGVSFMVMTFIHTITCYISMFTKGGWKGVAELLWPFPHLHYLYNRDNFTIPLIQFLTFASFITIGVIAVYEPIRRAKYDLFLICHHLTYMTLIPATLWHAQAAWEYMVPALALYVSDRLIRLYRGSQAMVLNQTTIYQFEHKRGKQTPKQPANVQIDPNEAPSAFSLHSNDLDTLPQLPIPSISSTKKVHYSNTISNETTGNPKPGVSLLDYGSAGRFIQIRIDNSRHNYVFFPGHYSFINIAEISLFEWHPMTIAGHVHAQSHELSFLIKCEGESNSWTNNLYNYVKTTADKQIATHREDKRKGKSSDRYTFLDIPLTISLDGPYGGPIDFNEYDNIVLVSGGAGVTPIKAVFSSLWLSFVHDYLGNDENRNLDAKQYFIDQLEETQKLNSAPLPPNQTGSNTRWFKKQTGDVEDAANVDSDETRIIPSKRVHLFFAARDPALFDCMADILSQIPGGPDIPFTAELICSHNGKLVPIPPTHTGPDCLDHHLSPQRDTDPELEECTALERSIRKGLGVESLSDIKDPTRTLFFACGPFRLTEQAKEIAAKYNFHQHEEQFEL